MPHLAAPCACGRKMRFPKGSTYGAKWTCWKCGRTYTLSTQGIPSHIEGSQPPPTSKYGCLLALAVLVTVLPTVGWFATVLLLAAWP